MKRLSIAFCIAVFASSFLHAQALTQEELKRAADYLEKTRAGVVEATRGLSEAQWNFKPAPDRWSVAEVTEHIAAAEDLLMGMIHDKVMVAPARTEPEDIKALDDLIVTAIPNRSKKLQAPEPLIPTNRFHSPQESLAHFTESRAKTVSFLKSTEGLRAHVADSPLGKKLDGYEWVLFIAAHSDRHTQQIKEVKADPHFPKS